ncbi:MAG: PAS domain S-box protein [Thermodesulfobacteriota bacterium]
MNLGSCRLIGSRATLGRQGNPFCEKFMEKAIKNKGLSIFQKLLLAFFSIALISLFISGIVHYRSRKEFLIQTIRTQLAVNVQIAEDHFNQLFADSIERNLSFIESSPLLDNYLTSRKDEILLTKPLVEKLLLFFTSPPESIYLSGRFIDSQGEEKIITQGRRRIKTYAGMDHFPNRELYRRIYLLYERLKVEQVRTILVEGPFKDENSRLTFMAGISKMDPEIGGFGGAVIFHCDLTAYLNWLATLKFNQVPIAYAFTPDKKLWLSPKKDSTPDTVRYMPDGVIQSDLTVSSSAKLGSHGDVLLNFALAVPRELFTTTFQKTLTRSALIGIFVIVFIVAGALFMSQRLFINPIRELVKGVRTIGGGHLKHRIRINTHDEIAQLADEFNQMAEGLEKTTVSRDILIQEIAEKNKIEAALRQSEARYRTLFDESPVMDVTTFNQEGEPVITDCNNLFADTLGYARKELLKQPLRNFYAPESVRKLMEGGGYQRALTAGIVAEERKLFTRDGRIVETLLRVLPEKNTAGAVCGTRAMYIDITRRKEVEKALRESEEKFRALFEQASIGVAELETKTGRFLRINQKYCDIAGYSLEEMMAATYMQITHPDDLQADLNNVRKIGEGEIHVYYREKRYVRKDGSIVWVHLTVSPIVEKGKQSSRHVAVVEDISERKQAEEERSRLILDLQRALAEVKTLSGLLPICSHCKKIRDDQGYWNQIESYIHKHSAAEFSHGICPECAKKYYPEYKLYDD